MAKTDKWLENIEKELENAKEKGEISSKIIELVNELRSHQIELKLQNEELKESQEELTNLYHKFHDLYNEIPVGYFTLDKRGIIRELNETAAELLHKRKGMIINRGFSQFILKKDENKYFTALSQAATTGDNQKLELQLKRDKTFFYGAMEIISRYRGDKESYRVIITDITERKEAEEALKESKERYSGVVQNTTAIILRINSQGIIQFANEHALEFFGYSADELIGKPALGTIVPEQETSGRDLVSLVDSIVASPDSFHYNENENMRKNGERVWMEWTNSGIYDNYGNLKEFLSVGIDVTERKKAEDVLKSSQQMLENVLENFPGVVFWKDRNSIYLGCNKNFSSRAGLAEPSEIIGKSDYDQELPWKNEAEQYRADDLQVIESEIPKLNIIETLRQADGQVAWYDTNKVPLRDPDGNVIGVLGTSKDITKRKKAEEKLEKAYDNLELMVQERTDELENAYKSLKESEEKFREIFNKANDMITLVELGENGLPGRFLDVNDVAPKRLGYSKEEFSKMKTVDIIYPECRPQMAENAKNLMKNRHARFEIVNMDKWGRKIPVEVSVHIFKLKGKDVILAISHDIRERKQAEKQLNETIKELKRSNQELQQFAYVSSHDLQEPLRTIASFTQLLERRYKGKFDSDADEFMDFIVEAAVRMKEQIEGLLEYSRVGTKGGEFDIVDTNEILKQTISRLGTFIKESDAEITYDELPVVTGDGEQLQRVFQNLISNAIRFRKCEEQLKIHISANNDLYNKEYVFSVRDNGIGIEEQYMERIFVIFQRLHTRDAYHGTGIGLSIVKRVIERHGGRVWVESDFGKGSTFYFTIPING